MRDMSIRIITENKKDFLPLLLLGDEQESQINKYLDRGELFALYNGDLKSVCAVTDEGNGTLEIQNLATDKRYQRKGYASRLIDYIAKHYAGRYDKIILGTGDVPGILAFYERRGFVITHRIPDYFTTHYDHPIIEDGVLLKDKVYLEKKLTYERMENLIIETIRVMQESDYECLPEFLYQAIFIPEGEEHPPRSIINDPEIFVYIKNFGTLPGDLGVVAEQNGQIIGAAWTRIIPAYGHIDNETPELAISILPEFRGRGIGSELMKKLFEVLRKNGYKQTSLSVQKDNPAVRFYQRLGYKLTSERLDHAGHEDYLMIKEL